MVGAIGISSIKIGSNQSVIPEGFSYKSNASPSLYGTDGNFPKVLLSGQVYKKPII